MRRRVLILITAVVLAVAVVTGVILIRGSSGPKLPVSVDVAVTAAHGATVRLASATLVIPPGAISANGRLAARIIDSKTGTNLSLNGKPEIAKPLISSAGQAVSFELTGARVIHPVTLTLSVSSAALAQAATGTNQRNAAWLAFYDETDQSWSPVLSEYNPTTQTVTARVSHLSTWNPFTWDWSAITLRMRQALSAFDSGRAPKASCPGVAGSIVTMAGGNDPPLIGCVTDDATSGFAGFEVSITNNRAYSMILQAPSGVVQQPRAYAGFEEYVQSRDLVTKALGGVYLAPVSTVTYYLPQTGTFTFNGAASFKTTVLDLGTTVAETIFDGVTLGYGKCVLDNVANSGAAPLSEAPKLITECFPALNIAVELVSDIFSLEDKVTNILATTDWISDTALNIHGEVHVGLPINWNNRQYALTCDNIVQTPVNIAFSGGNATAHGPGIGPYEEWDMSIAQVAHGVLPSLGNVTAVLFSCSPQPSNFGVAELRIYHTADGSEVGLIPELPTDGGVLPGVYNAGSITIANGHLSADVMFYGPGDSHASGPSVPGHLSWSWNGHEFITDASPGTA
jgi:hypothetical protein